MLDDETLTQSPSPNGTSTAPEDLSLPVHATPVKPPTAAGRILLDEWATLEPREAQLRQLRLFDTLQRNIYDMADMLGLEPAACFQMVETARGGYPLMTWTSRKRSSVTLQYVPSAHLQKLASELLQTVEIIHGRLTVYLLDPYSKIRPDFAVNAISKLLDKIITIRGIASRGINDEEDAVVSHAQLDATREKFRSLNKKLEATQHEIGN